MLLLGAPAWPQATLPPIETPPITVTAGPGSLTVPTPEAAREEMRRTPGSVEVVPAEVFRDSRAKDLKDMLDYVPGVYAQPKFGNDTRLVIRGSGLARNFHLRGVRLLLDGIPFNLADGSGDTQEVDALALSYLEVFKGANGLRWGASSLGGAINLVTPSGRTADLFTGRLEYGSYDFMRGALSHGMSAGAWDWFGAMSWLSADHFRDQSKERAGRIAANAGYRFSDTAETRFYVIHAGIDQQVPGSLFRGPAYSDPKQAAAINKINNWQRDVSSTIVANRTAVRVGDAELSFGGYFRDKDLFHPIFVVIDQNYTGYGGFTRLSWDGTVGGHRNIILVGANLDVGRNLSKWFVNMEARKGPKLRDEIERSSNLDLYAENHFYLTPALALVAGLQFNRAGRRLDDRFLSDGDDSGRRSYTSLNPKAGFVWDVAKDWQVYGNLSRSSEPPTFSDLNPTAAPGFANVDAQKSITAELGTRGRRPDYSWDVTVYHAWLRDELQTFQDSSGATITANAGRTIHRGLEAGFGRAFLRNLAVTSEQDPDRLWLRGAYTFSDYRFDGDAAFGSNKLPGAPRHYLRAELRYEHPSGFFLAPNIEWAPQGYYIDNANSQRTRAYALIGLRAGYDFGNGVSAFIDGRNLTDRKYVSSTGVVPVASAANSNVYNPGDRLTVYGGLQVRF
jgi:iron complex outermembrane receptor protein